MYLYGLGFASMTASVFGRSRIETHSASWSSKTTLCTNPVLGGQASFPSSDVLPLPNRPFRARATGLRARQRSQARRAISGSSGSKSVLQRRPSAVSALAVFGSRSFNALFMGSTFRASSLSLTGATMPASYSPASRSVTGTAWRAGVCA